MAAEELELGAQQGVQAGQVSGIVYREYPKRVPVVFYPQITQIYLAWADVHNLFFIIFPTDRTDRTDRSDQSDQSEKSFPKNKKFGNSSAGFQDWELL